MIDDLEQREHDLLRQQLNRIVEEENHYKRLARVFGTEDGFCIFEWLLELTGYWSTNITGERNLARFELGRTLFDQLSLADLNLALAILDHRCSAKLAEFEKEKQKILEKLK